MFRIDPEKNSRVKQKLQALLGSKFDLSTLAVFEGLANDTLPITGAGGIYKASRMTQTYLDAMSAKVQNGEFVPIIKLHDQHGSLPVGRIFDAASFESTAGEGETDLHILFYVDSKSEADLVAKLETGSVAEISTGTTPSSLQCSSCGYDFLASEDNKRRLWSGKGYTPLCSEGHQWGVGGNHLKLANLSSWKETSAVTRGAVSRAHILSEKELRLAVQSNEISLAAHADDDKLLLVTLQDGEDNPVSNGTTPSDQGNGKNNMTDISVPLVDYNKLVLSQGKVDEVEAKFAAAEQAKADAETAKAAAEQAKVDAEQAKTDAETAKVDAETKLQAAEEKVTQLTAQLAAATNGGGDRGKGVGADGANGDSPEANLANKVSGLDTSYYKVTP